MAYPVRPMRTKSRDVLPNASASRTPAVCCMRLWLESEVDYHEMKWLHDQSINLRPRPGP